MTTFETQPEQGNRGFKSRQPDMNENGRVFNVDSFLARLDAMFADHTAKDSAETFILEALNQARQLDDRTAQLTILNELMGFYRSQSKHAQAVEAAEQALALADNLQIAGSDASTTSLINAATAYRAAGQTDRALELYRQALAEANHSLAPTDRRLAALHNNLSIAYSEAGDYASAQQELETALHLLQASSPNPASDIDVGSTHANLALVCYRNGAPAQAAEHAEQALQVFRAGGHEDAGHYSSALAAAGEAFFHMGRLADSITAYEQALAAIETAYGTDNDYYAITAANLEQVRQASQAAQAEQTRSGEASVPDKPISSEASGRSESVNPVQPSRPTSSTPATAEGQTAQPNQAAHISQPDISGLSLARRYWEEYGEPLLSEQYAGVRGRIAVGLVGHGSEVYGFDDAFSRDHDFAPRFCLWLTPADYADFGERLQHDYEALPADFLGFSRADISRTPRSQGTAHRDGVFVIPDFYAGITGSPAAPADTAEQAVHWLLLDEASLAAATNGAVFADPLGEFSRVRQGFLAMPDDVRLSLISRRLGMVSQAGQYNFPRMLARGQAAGAWRSLNEFVHATATLVFLLNGPAAAGYLPYYKWEMAALRRLSGRMGAKLPQVADLLDDIMAQGSAACYGSSQVKGSGAASSLQAQAVSADINTICGLIRDELVAQGLSRSRESFLEWQRPYVEEAINNPQLRSL